MFCLNDRLSFKLLTLTLLLKIFVIGLPLKTEAQAISVDFQNSIDNSNELNQVLNPPGSGTPNPKNTRGGTYRM